MAPASYAALCFAIRVAEEEAAAARGRWSKQDAELDEMDRMLGTDILVPRPACDALSGLVRPASWR